MLGITNQRTAWHNPVVYAEQCQDNNVSAYRIGQCGYSSLLMELLMLPPLVDFIVSYFSLQQLRLYKGYYQVIAGANPMQAQLMLSSAGGASLLRRRGQKVS